MKQIGVIGGGAWGTALAQVYAAAGRKVTLWAREEDVVQSINARHENTGFLPGYTLHANLKATFNLNEATQAEIILLVPPAQYLRATLESAKNSFAKKTLVICAKGIEIASGKLLSQVAEETVPDATVAVVTGPTFASEIARGLPAAVTLATKDLKRGKELQQMLGTKTFRPYLTDDVTGAQVAGAIKNVIAIACGIVHGRKMGESARAAILTRGAAEIARLSRALGGRADTIMGMCGIGDMVLTCSSMQSRNFSLGAALGEGKTLDEILGPRKAVTEGVYTAQAAAQLAKKLKIEMPVCEAVNRCLNENLPIEAAITDMLSRPFTYESQA